jgi:hypothetical protein
LSIFFFENENRGATPRGNRNHILTEETKIKLQRGGTYALPNQWLGNEGGGGTSKERNNSRNSNRAALQEKLKSTKPVFDRRMEAWLESAKMLQNQCLKFAFQTARCGGLPSKMASFLCF